MRSGPNPTIIMPLVSTTEAASSNEHKLDSQQPELPPVAQQQLQLQQQSNQQLSSIDDNEMEQSNSSRSNYQLSSHSSGGKDISSRANNVQYKNMGIQSNNSNNINDKMNDDSMFGTSTPMQRQQQMMSHQQMGMSNSMSSMMNPNFDFASCIDNEKSVVIVKDPQQDHDTNGNRKVDNESDEALEPDVGHQVSKDVVEDSNH
jgi:hypothetical protein